MKKGVVIISTLLLMSACGGGSSNKNTNTEKTEIKTFKYVNVPPIMSDKNEIAKYMATHFWDNFTFIDTAYISLPKEFEQAIANYVDVLMRVDSSVSAKSLADVVKRSESDTAMFKYITDNLLSYVGDPNSPLRDNILHVNLLKVLMANPNVDPTERVGHEHKLRMNSKNMRGMRATDFRYFTRKGAKGNLHGVKSDYTILFFNHLGCNSCAEVKTQFEDSALINSLIKDKKLTILGIFPDEDKNEWINGNNEFDPSWINGADTGSEIEKKELYYIPAIPSLYLLSKDKTVILKDANASDVLDVLTQLQPL